MKTFTGDFLDRMRLTKRLEENLEEFLGDHGFKVLPFGHPVILHDNTWIRSRLRKIDSKASLAAIMIKFSPDYIIIPEYDPESFFFADAKVSITPVFFGKQIERIKNHYGKDPQLSRKDIGGVEREAWFSYNKFFPGSSVALIIATPYNPGLALADWASNIECMWCLRASAPGNPVPWNCSKCPVFSDRGGFGVVVNEFAAGSGTPHTNIHLGSMRTLGRFLEDEFSTEIDQAEYQVILDYVKTWTLEKPRGRVNWRQYNNAVKELRSSCPWLKCRIKDEFIPCPGDEQGSIF